MVSDSNALSEYARWVLEPQLPERPTEPRLSCLICATPRAGSWLLSGLLHSTGVAGHPHEYFYSETEAANRRLWSVSTATEHLDRVLEAGTTDNGVFACKLTWGVLSHFLRQLSARADGDIADDRSLIERLLPRPRFVFLWRADAAAQAVSWAKAGQTGYFHHWDSANRAPRFDFEQIDALVREVTNSNAAWRSWFAANEIDPLEVRFEDLVEDQEAQTLRVLRFLGVELPPGVAIAARTVKTRDAVNQEWLDRYRIGR